MARVRVIPAEGRRVRDDLTGAAVPPEGAVVTNSVYWFRKASSGDVTIEEFSEGAAPASKSASRSSASREE